MGAADDGLPVAFWNQWFHGLLFAAIGVIHNKLIEIPLVLRSMNNTSADGGISCDAC